MSIVFNDTFTEGSDTALASHTPDTGAGWTQAQGATLVVAAADRAEADDFASGNRVSCSDDFGQSDMVVEGDFRGDTGTNIFFGPTARKATAATTDTTLEFTYDRGAGGGSWNLDTDQLVEAWPGDPVTMTLEADDGTPRGLADAVEKVSVTNSDSGQFAGMILGNFDGSDGPNPECDNFTVDVVAGGPIGVVVTAASDIQ